MGAWGHRIFDDDMTCDALDEISESSNPFEAITVFINEALENAQEYLDYDSGAYGLAAAAVIDAKLNGINKDMLFEIFDDYDDELFKGIFEKINEADALNIKKSAALAVRAVAGENSELRELWEENKELYPEVIKIWTKLAESLEYKI